MDETHQLGSNVNLYSSLSQDDHNDGTDTQNSDITRASSESKKVSFKEDQQPRQVIQGHQNPPNASSQSQHMRTSSSIKNIQSSSHGTPNKDQQILNSNIAAHSNVNPRMSDAHVIVSSNRNRSRSPNDDQNMDQQLRTQPESTGQYKSPNRLSIDTETDAKPMTPHSSQTESLEFGAKGGTYETFKKTEEMLCFENNVLRPKDHYDQPLTPKHLIDMVIVYAKSDYQKALNYKLYLKDIADKNGMEDIKIELYTSEDFPNNDVRVVEEVVNRAMRVLMLLSANFSNEVNLNFIKEETIGMTRLQELPPQEQISLFATTIMNRKKHCIRPVHTVPKKEQYSSYKTPVGLSALRGFEFFPENKNQSYENAMALEFLKKAREDRIYHMNELRRHQALDNPYISQISEKDRTGQFLRTNQGELDISDKTNKDESLRNNTFRSIESKQQHSIREMPVMTSNGTGTSARPLPQENSSVVCPSKQKVELINRSNTKPIGESSCITSSYVSHRSCEHVFMGKEDSLPTENAQSNVPSSKTVQNNNPIKRDPPKLSLLIPNTSESFDPSVEKDCMSSLEHGDEEEDKSADSILPKTSDGLESPPSLLMSDSLVSDEIKEKQDEFPPKSHLGYNQQDVILQAKMKLMNLEGPGDVRESKVSYSGPSGRSGIRSGASPGYDEYLVGTPNGRRSGSSHAMDDSAGLGTRSQTTNRAPNLTGYPPPQSIHYHYHYPDQGQGIDVEEDQGPGTFLYQSESRRPPSSVRRRLSSPNRVKSGPIFNIQGCATVQIGDANVVTGNQTVEATNNNRMNDNDSRNNRNEQRDDWSPESPDSQRGDGSPQSAGIIMEEPRVHGGQPEGSLNMLSPSNDPVKKVEYESSDSNSDEDNSNIPPDGKGLDSAEMFGNGADLTQNLSSSFTDKTYQNKTEKATLKDEIFQKAHNSGNILTNEKGTMACASDKDIRSMENSKSSLNVTSLKSSTKDSVSSLELVSLSSHLRKGTFRKDLIALKLHYNQNVRCEITCSGALHDDDVD
ncbi:uncharacterized protein LOC134721323 [Mytilus trossulus]|uniref:uncharacterized protein LOC134721323 n=1 Tax=Mytilus trossulus TaxID=6551 RepID=UPI0030073F60